MATRVYVKLDALRAIAEQRGWTKPGGRDRLNATAIADAIGVNTSTVTRIIGGDPCGPATISGLLAVTDVGFDDLFTRESVNVMSTVDQLRTEFVRLLTEDGPTTDRRRKDYNQALFNGTEGWAVWDRTTLDMVMGKFDRAAANIARGGVA